MSESSYRTILRSSSIIGGSSAVNVLSGLVKMKAAALLLGPAGVGLVGLYQNLIQTGATVASLGAHSVGTREVAAAEATGEAEAVGQVRRALFWGTGVLAAIGGLVFWLASDWIATQLLQAPERKHEVAWLALGVALTVGAGSQAALLTGLRRIVDIARVQVVSAILGCVLGVFALWQWGARGLLALVLIAPVVAFLIGHYYVARLGPPAGKASKFRELAGEWRKMAPLGIAIMLSGLVTTLGHLAVRTIVKRELGAIDLGYFQAAWSIGMTYLAFVLAAMGTDYFPRLTTAINDPVTASRLVNEQTEVALILCGPILLAMIALAPWVVPLLYSSVFGPAIEIMRWQLLGDILKVMSWPLGFILLASGAGKTFIATETIGIGVLVAGVALGTPLIGVRATGIAFMAAYVCYLPLVYFVGGRRINFRWSAAVIRQALALVTAAVLLVGLARWSDRWAAALGFALACGFALIGIAQLGKKADPEGRFGSIFALSRRICAHMSRLR